MSAQTDFRPLFPLGNLVATPGALNVLEKLGENNVTQLLVRYMTGDWGDLDQDDQKANDRAISEGTRIFGAYEIPVSQYPKLWIITEADRSVTTILLPEEY